MEHLLKDTLGARIPSAQCHPLFGLVHKVQPLKRKLSSFLMRVKAEVLRHLYSTPIASCSDLQCNQ